MHSAEYGTYTYGRLTYRTANEARAVAEELGLSSVHQHEAGGELVWMPGDNMQDLNAALQAMGLPPVSPPSQQGGGDLLGGFGFDDEDGGGLL